METSDIVRSHEQPISFQPVLKRIDIELKNSGIAYYVVGSVARRAYMNLPLRLSSDIDVLIPDKQQRTLAEKLIMEIQTEFPGTKIDHSLSSYLVRNGEDYELVYGNLKRVINSSLMQVREVAVGDMSIPTLPPETLLHIYVNLGKPFREKDWNNALEFARFLKAKPKEFDHKLFLPFHEFNKIQMYHYPLVHAQTKWREFLKTLPPDIRNFVYGTIYPSKPMLTARQFFNRLSQWVCT